MLCIFRSLLPVSGQLRTLGGGVLHQSSKSYSLLAKEPFRPKPFNFEQQSIVLPGPEKVRSSLLLDDPAQVIDSIPGSPEVKTVYDVLKHGLKVSNDGPCIGTKPPGSQDYQWSTYSEVISRTQNIGSGFIELGLNPRNDSFIGIFAANREEFFLSLYACAGYSMVLVPFFLSLSLPSVTFIINHAKLSLVIANNDQNTMAILGNIKQLPTVKVLVTCHQPTDEQRKVAEAENVKILSFNELEEIGKSRKKDLVIPDPDDVSCIPFTSGTTGIPKGVMLTHRNIISCVSSLVYGYGKAGLYGGTIISYLPPAHIYEICNEIASSYFARGVAFYSGEIKNLFEELRRLKPSILPLVPRLMGLMHAEVMKKINESRIKSALFPIALWHKEKLIKRGKLTKKTVWDRYLFRHFQELIGGETHLISVTSAPVQEDLKRFFVLASGTYVFEVYGSTESLSVTMTLPEDTSSGHVGAPVISNHVKLVDVQDMGYLSKDDMGEICVKGHSVFKGYLHNPEATKESLVDGWYHSGDVGKWLPNGTLKIIDRKKHLFKLSQGIYIAPEKVENAYSFCNLVLQILVDGIPGKDYTIALVLPEPTLLKQWLATKGYEKTENLSEILSNKEIRREFLLKLHKYGREKNLTSLEQVRNMSFIPEPFSINNDMLTPTFKVRRNVARKHYETLYQKLYEEGQLIDSLKS